METAQEGIATSVSRTGRDAEIIGIDTTNGRELFRKTFRVATDEACEFLAVVEAAKLIISESMQSRRIFTRCAAAARMFNDRTAPKERGCQELGKAEVFLKALSWDLETVVVTVQKDG